MAARTSIYLPGYGHANPVPVASRIGSFLFSGVLTGRDPVTKEMPADLAVQCANVFAHVSALMSAAGGSIDNIAKMTFWLADYRDRESLNRAWIEAFPDPLTRPARQAVAGQLDGGALIHCDLVAVMETAD